MLKNFRSKTTFSNCSGPEMLGCWGPDQCLETKGLCPGRGIRLLLLSLQVQPVSKLSKYLRATDRTLMVWVTQTATGKVLPSTAQDSHRTQPPTATSPPSLALAESSLAQQVSDTGAHTTSRPSSHTHSQMH